jgi:hypothetical protein
MLWTKQMGANFDNVLLTNTKIQALVLKFVIIKIFCQKSHEMFSEHPTISINPKRQAQIGSYHSKSFFLNYHGFIIPFYIEIHHSLHKFFGLRVFHLRFNHKLVSVLNFFQLLNYINIKPYLTKNATPLTLKD